MVKSDLFCRIQAGFYNRPVARYQNNEASSLSASMIAAPSLGLYNNLEESIKAMSPGVELVFQPHSKDQNATQKLIAAKKKLYTTLAEGQVYEQFMGI